MGSHEEKRKRIPVAVGKFFDRWNKSPTVQEIYQARWVWYHSLLALLLFFVNIQLFIIMVVLIVKF